MLRFSVPLVLLAIMSSNIPSFPGTPPQLKELATYYPFSGTIVPLGVFDSINGVKNAIATSDWFNSPTWYLRNLTDTSNSFTWKNGAPFCIGDYNGDGFTDYFMAHGGILVGKSKKSPPDTTTVLTSQTFVTGTNYTYDLNNDRKSDVILCGDGTDGQRVNPKLWGYVGYGNQSIAAMKFLPIYPPTYTLANTTMQVLKVYPKGNEWRVVWREDNKFDHYFWIGSLEFSDTAVTVRRINAMHFGGAYVWVNFCNAHVYFNKRTQEATLLGIHCNTGTNFYGSGINVFSLDRDTIEYLRSYPYAHSEVFSYDQLHGEPYNEGWVTRYNKDSMIFFSGSPKEDVQTGIISRYLKANADGGLVQSVTSIGDINNDGICDYAVTIDGQDYTFLKLYEGRSQNTYVANQIEDIIFRDIAPHPINKNQPFTLYLSGTIGSSYSISLYSLNGSLVTAIDSGFTTQSDQGLSISLANQIVSSGSYSLWVSIGNAVYSKIVLITE